MTMKLKTFLDMLTEVELSQHIFGQSEEENLVKGYELINLINRGMTDIYTRFVIKKGEILLDVDSSFKAVYDLKKTNLVVGDNTYPSIIRVLEVWNECGEKVHINPIHRYIGCSTTMTNSVSMRDKNTLVIDDFYGCLTIVYQKGPNLITRPTTIENFRPENIDLDIDVEYIDALIYYVCARLFSVNLPMEGYAAQYSPSVTYHKRYEEECARLSDINLEIEGTEDTFQRFHNSTFP